MAIKPKAAIVTGAGSGIGRAAAAALLRAGWRVTLVSRTESDLRDTAAQSGVADGALVQPADVTDAGACAGIVEATWKRWGRLDALVNVAGAAVLQPLAQTTPAQWRRIIDTNLSAIVYLTTAAWPTFAAQKSGTVVNVSSMASLDPFDGFSLYAAAKAGVNMYTYATAQEGKAIGVRAVALAVGAVETPMLRSLFDYDEVPQNKTMDPVAVGAFIADCVTGARPFTSGDTLAMRSPGEVRPVRPGPPR